VREGKTMLTTHTLTAEWARKTPLARGVRA